MVLHVGIQIHDQMVILGFCFVESICYILLDSFTGVFFHKACSALLDDKNRKSIQGINEKFGFKWNLVLQKKILKLYGLYGEIGKAGILFANMPKWDVYHLVKMRDFEGAFRFFLLMPEKDMSSWIMVVFGCVDYKKLEDGVRKLVIATNMADISIIINDVVFVVDGGKTKGTSYKIIFICLDPIMTVVTGLNVRDPFMNYPSAWVVAVVGTTLPFTYFAKAVILARRRGYLYLGGLLSSMFVSYMAMDTSDIIEMAHWGDLDDETHAFTLFTDIVAAFGRILIFTLKNLAEKMNVILPCGSTDVFSVFLFEKNILEGARVELVICKLARLISDEKLVDLLDLALFADIINTIKSLRLIMEIGVEPLALMSQLAIVIIDIRAHSYDFSKGRRRRKFFRRQPLSKKDMEKLWQALKTLFEVEKQLSMSNDKIIWLIVVLLHLVPDQQYILPISSVHPSSLPSLPAFSIVKPMQMNEVLDASKEMFASLVPDSSAKALSMYTEMVDDVIRTQAEKLQQGSELTRVRLKKMELLLNSILALEGNFNLLEDFKNEVEKVQSSGAQLVWRLQIFLEYIQGKFNHIKVSIESMRWCCSNFKGCFENKDVWCVTKSDFQIIILEDKDVLKEGVLLHAQIYCHPKRRVSLK